MDTVISQLQNQKNSVMELRTDSFNYTTLQQAKAV